MNIFFRRELAKKSLKTIHSGSNQTFVGLEVSFQLYNLNFTYQDKHNHLKILLYFWTNPHKL